MAISRRQTLQGIMMGAYLSENTSAFAGTDRLAGPPVPTALYAAHSICRTPGQTDIVVMRERDAAVRTFGFTARGLRDTPGIAAFLGDGAGRVLCMADQMGKSSLRPPPGASGPLIRADVVTRGVPGLLFDNSGAFQGNPPALHQGYHATALAMAGCAFTLQAGFSIVAAMRLGNVASVAAGSLWTFGAQGSMPFATMAGHANPDRPPDQACDLTLLLEGASVDLGLSPPSTPSVLGLSFNHALTTALCRDQVSLHSALTPPPVTWGDLLLGTTQPGAGAGWQLDGLAVFDHSLTPDAMRAWGVELAGGPPPVPRGTIVLDGSSVEAGVGSTALRSESRLYEAAFPDYEIDNVAVGGATIAARLQALPSTLQFLIGRPGPQILLTGAGANTLSLGVAADVAYAQTRDYVQLVRQVVPGVRIGLTTITPVRVALLMGRGAAYAAYNTLVRQNTAGADFISDRAADPIMGNPAHFDPIDPVVSLDGGHPTDFGHRRLADIDIAAIRSVLPPSSTRG